MFASLQGLTRVQSFEKGFKIKSQSYKNGLKWDWLTFSLLTKNIKVLLNWLKFIYENILKIHGHKSKFIMKAVQVQKQEEFSKGGRRILKLKKMGGDEGAIL